MPSKHQTIDNSNMVFYNDSTIVRNLLEYHQTVKAHILHLTYFFCSCRLLFRLYIHKLKGMEGWEHLTELASEARKSRACNREQTKVPTPFLNCQFR
jgi:hypothetical protein